MCEFSELDRRREGDGRMNKIEGKREMGKMEGEGEMEGWMRWKDG